MYSTRRVLDVFKRNILRTPWLHARIGRSGNTTVAAQQLSRPIEGMTGGTGNNRRRTEETKAGGLEILGKPGTDTNAIGGGR
ncbi:uncharacterized protein SPSK_10726 [Sporothrix schenckii 1099-18]|uniref:Uncharacterized protein n=1 Tax=Sporothrix schenckii 1099-18 TaxID=1397361 RepID=A0A0F2MK64_SPOSC|nr:uncharacterized protein SPSK_10726 [Sporothrix schenckii 1099-18]KJR89444.1 hypothetical protein SPSK_10726 [Sporothrix schenckii 1099-18]